MVSGLVFATTLTVPAEALTLALPDNAEQTASDTRPAVQATFPASPWADGKAPSETAEGTLLRTAWRLDAATKTTLQILAPLRRQITAAGYEIAFQCEARACGSFDFRFATNTLDAPRMHVDLADYHYLLARRGDEWVSMMVSRAGDTGFVQLTRLIPGDATPASPPPPEMDAPEAAAIWEELERNGHAPLDDLLFETGAAELEGTQFPSLGELAERMEHDPGLRLTLVGHTDAEGGLAANIALSKRRAEAVRDVLVDTYGADPARIEAAGVGYLAPRASNASPEGRRANRRVEVVLPQ